MFTPSMEELLVEIEELKRELTREQMRRPIVDANAGWGPLFRSWMEQWCGEFWRDNTDPDFIQAYKKGFRAGWRAARRESNP